MELQQLVLVAAVVVFAVGTFYLIGLLNKLKETLNSLDSTVVQLKTTATRLEEEVVPLLSQLKETAASLKELGDAATKAVTTVEGEIKPLSQELQGALSQLQATLATVGRGVEEISQTMAAAGRGLDQRLQREIPELLNQLKEMAEHFGHLAEGINQRLAKTDELFEAIGEAGQTAQTVTKLVRGGLTQLAVEVASMAVGLKTTLRYLTETLGKEVDKR